MEGKIWTRGEIDQHYKQSTRDKIHHGGGEEAQGKNGSGDLSIKSHKEKLYSKLESNQANGKEMT